MFDIGFTELLIVGIVALIVVGPKDLPGMFRSFGKFTGKARGMAREFQRAMDAAADETGVKDIARDLKKTTSAKSMGLDALKDAADTFQKWDPTKPRAPEGTKQVLATTDPGAVAEDAPKPALGPNTEALAKAQAEQRAARLAAAAERRAAKAVSDGPAAEKAPAKPRKSTKTTDPEASA